MLDDCFLLKSGHQNASSDDASVSNHRCLLLGLSDTEYQTRAKTTQVRFWPIASRGQRLLWGVMQTASFPQPNSLDPCSDRNWIRIIGIMSMGSAPKPGHDIEQPCWLRSFWCHSCNRSFWC